MRVSYTRLLPGLPSYERRSNSKELCTAAIAQLGTSWPHATPVIGKLERLRDCVGVFGDKVLYSSDESPSTLQNQERSDCTTTVRSDHPVSAVAALLVP